MRQKMVNLCLTSYELAREMPNFSDWVRTKILEAHQKKVKVNAIRCEECGFTPPRHLSRCSHYQSAYVQMKMIDEEGE